MTRGQVDFQHARRVAVGIAEEAGALLLGRFAAGIEARPKGDFGDVVTDLDLAAEELIVARLRTAFPGHRIIAEESGVHPAGVDQDAGVDHDQDDHDQDDPGSWTWLVDPLDGTNNVAIGMAAFVVGLALCDGDRRPVVGVVHDPVTRQTWSAVTGAGAIGPAGLLRPKPRKMPHGKVLGWTQGHGVLRTDDTSRALKLVLEMNCYRLLQLWAPLICWVMLARGQIDGFIGYHAEAIDLPAGSLIAAEAGLAIVSLDGSPFSETVVETARRSFVAGHPGQVDHLLELVKTAEKLKPEVAALHSLGLNPLTS